MSLHDKTMLISLTLAGIPSARADKQITADVLFQKNAQADAGRWVSRLWPKEAMEPIRAIDARIRALHYQKTLPWMDKGERILASRTFTAYMDEMRGLRMERETLVQGFLDHYEVWIDKARDMRGDAFNSAEYPNYWQAKKKFRFEIAAAPVPHSADFRVTLAAEEMDEIQASLDARVRNAELTARTDLYRRMAEPVARLVERLAEPDARFTASSLNALREIIAQLPEVNVLDDPEIEMLRQTIETQLCHLNPEQITESRSDRSRALTKANDILAKMAPWMDAIEDEDEEQAAA